jgi:hypothetical protein
VVQQRGGARGIDAPVQELDVLRLARQHVHEVEARQIRVLQCRELLAEHHGARRAVAVEQRERGRGLDRKRGLDDRQERGDAAARRESDVMVRRRRIERHVEVAHRRHDVEGHARAQRFVGPGRERAAGRLLDRDAQRVVLHRGADRIRAPQVLAGDVRAQRQVLAGARSGTARAARRAP